MDSAMKPAFRLFRRKCIYWSQNNETGQQKSLHTSDKGEAQRLLNSKNEAAQNPAGLNRQIGRNYLAMSGDPLLATRTWKDLLDRMLDGKTGSTRERLERAGKDKAYGPLWIRPLLETKPDELNKVVEAGTVATNVFLRRMHNYAFDMDWLPVRIISKRLWKKIVYGETRAITQKEHQKVIAKELNKERRSFYELCWYTGGSQGDVASLCAEDIDCEKNTIKYRRRKTAVNVLQKMGPKVKAILAELPATGPLFPNLTLQRQFP
jgi:integrase